MPTFKYLLRVYWAMCFIAFAFDKPIAQAASPALFFTDLESGPNTGGQDNLGPFITIYGEGFGAQRGNSTVTIAGQEVARYVIWGENNAIARDLDMIVVQPGPNAVSGDIVVTVNGQASNPLPFTVRSGNIYFVISGAPNANDANPGTYAEPFRTLYRPRQVLAAGDIVYIKGGTFSTADPEYPGWDAVLLLHPDTDPNGTADRPVAYIGYPGDRPVISAINDPQTLRRGIYMDATMTYYIIANLGFTQGYTPYEDMLAMSGNGHRAVGNYFYDGLASTALGIGGNSSQLKIFGNFLRNNGNAAMEDGVGFYIQGFGTNQDIDLGWNQIQDQGGRRGIQLFGHSDGDWMDNIRIHDNMITTSLPLRNNILLGGSDGGTDVLGTIYVYNNIIVGSEGQGLRVNDPQGTVIIQNNVLYNNGSLGFDGYGQIHIERAGAGRITLQNNIVFAESGQTYYDFGPGAEPSAFAAASNNLWFNAGAAPGWDANSVNADPMFIDAASADFRLTENSPAINAGINTGIDRDFVGILRDSHYDIGAYEYVLATAVEARDHQSILVNDIHLSQNYPNPFNTSTTIQYTLPERSEVALKVFDEQGREVTQLVHATQAVGSYSVSFKADDLASGIYFYRLEVSGKSTWSETHKFVFLK